MNLKLIEYISKRLAPKEYRLELQNRLENLCALSGTPMSPGLHQWVTEKFGLEMTRVIEDYSTFTSPKLSPELLSVVDRIVPTNYQGYDANLGLKQLFDVGCAPPDCWYYAKLGQFSNLGYPAADFGQYYLDTNGTQQAFDILNDGQNGGGALRTLMMNNDGNVAGVYNPNNPVDWNYWIYYYGQDIFAPYLPLYDINGTLINFITFQKIDAIGGYCDLVNYSLNIPYGEEFAYQFIVNNTSETYIFDYLNFPNVIYPTGTTLLDLSDTLIMQDYVTTLFGNGASYTITNTGSDYLIEISKAIYWGELPSIYSNGLNYYQFSLA
jgi:hypothetical protein